MGESFSQVRKNQPEVECDKDQGPNFPWILISILQIASNASSSNSHQRCSIKEAVLKIFTVFTGKHLCFILFSKKQLWEKRLQRRCFPVNIVKFLSTIILKNICERLFLFLQKIRFFQTLSSTDLRDVFCRWEDCNWILL